MNGQIDGLTEDQLMERILNQYQLSANQQQELVKMLKQKQKKDLKSQKKQQYNNIYTILTENVAKAKMRLANLYSADNPRRGTKEDEETLERIKQ